MALPAPDIERSPRRPGPGTTNASVLKAVDLVVKRRIEGMFAGEFRSARSGLGTELHQVRPYVPGDDVRLIDWNVTARTRQPHVRVQVAERALVTWLMLDLSPSMIFGTQDRRKVDVAEGVALAVGHLATRHGNRLGLLTFGGREARVIPPRQGRPGLLGLLAALRMEPDEEGGGATSIGTALARVGRLARWPSLIVVASDFRGPRDWRGPILDLAGRHDVVAVEVRDEREQNLPNVGCVWLADPETGRQMQVDTGDSRLRSRFAQEAARERHELARELASAGVDHVVVWTAGDWLRELAQFLRLRGRAR